MQDTGGVTSQVAGKRSRVCGDNIGYWTERSKAGAGASGGGGAEAACGRRRRLLPTRRLTSSAAPSASMR